jgi:hypothetical protein
MEIMIYPALIWVHMNLLTTQRALSAKAILAGMFLSLFCVAQLKLELSAMTDSLSFRTNAISYLLPFTMLAAALTIFLYLFSS